MFLFFAFIPKILPLAKEKKVPYAILLIIISNPLSLMIKYLGKGKEIP